MRKLALVKKVDRVAPIPNCDAIELVFVGGWQAIVKKSEFKEGDSVVYIEVDSFLPEGNPHWDFLVQKKSTEYGGRKGHVLKTLKMRGCLSQGLVLPLTCLQVPGKEPLFNVETGESLVEDFADHLGISLYVSENFSSGNSVADFPTRLFPKTDQERYQNISGDTLIERLNSPHVVTEKLDGASMSVFFDSETGEFGVCSRNFMMDTSNQSDLYVQAAVAVGLQDKLKSLGKSIVLQGELVGPKIQGNKYKLETRQFFVYTVRDLRSVKHYSFEDLKKVCQELSLQYVPEVQGLDTSGLTPDNVYSTLDAFATKKSVLNGNTDCEGFVFWGGDFSFKVINNMFLLSEK